jgi:hypothetical protein
VPALLSVEEECSSPVSMSASNRPVVDFENDSAWHDLFYGTLPTPKRIQELNQFLNRNPERMIRLYHGTDAKLPIMEKGLLPTSTMRRRSLQSGSGYVYLSVYHGMANDFGRMGNPGKVIEVYKVEIPIRMLSPDKDQLANKRCWGQDSSIGRTLADSLIVGHGACVKGTIQPYAIRPTIGRLPSDWTERPSSRPVFTSWA